MKPRRSSSHHSVQEQLGSSRRHAYLVITLAFPFVLLIVLEVGLHLFHYGPDLSLFTTEALHGKTYHIMNPAVRHRYFSRVSFKPSSSPDYFSVPKPNGTFRIFCLGGSTTVGFPYWYNTAFSTFLRDRLQRTFPDRPVEVINVAMTATNSYTVVDMAEELIDYEPDLFIVYDGHNEFYGALGIASRESMGGARWLSRLSLKLAHVKTYQLALDIYASFAKLFGSADADMARGTMMERLAKGKTVPLDSPTYRAGLEIFGANLRDLKELCAHRNIPLILGTQVSNLRGLAPFVSGTPSDIAPSARVDFHTRFNRGLECLSNNRPDSALNEFRFAAAIIPRHAEVHYRIARCLDTLGRTPEALPEYIAARDFDELRFRTSSDFNAAIRAMDDGHLLLCADIESTFAAASPGGITGNNLILEHLHPNARGQFLIATTYARIMRAHHLFVSDEQWSRADTLSDAAHWTARSMTPIDERIAARRTEALVTAWPFQPEEMPVSDIPASDTLGQIADRLAHGQIHWKQAHDLAIEYYVTRNDARALELEYRTVINQLPYIEVSPYLRLARLLLDQQRIGEVRSVLERSLIVEPTILAHRALADIALNSSNPAAAIPYYLKTFSFPQSPPEQVENGTLLATSYFRSGDTTRARERLRIVLAIKPDYMPAVQLLEAIETRR
jgi:tetratricopeptide (TPR) repeat protein